jgi:hypothetical protein
MYPRTDARLVLLVVVPFFVLSGCAPGSTSTDSPAGGEPLPLWVRLVLPSRDGRSIFVGGVSFALDPDQGVGAAVADAESKLVLEAGTRFKQHFDRNQANSGVETTAMERMGFKRRVSDRYGERMLELARRDSVYHTPCVAPEDDAGAHGSAAVCRAFAMISVDESAWDTVMAEALLAEKQRLRGEERPALAELAEWLARVLLEPVPREGRADDR